jgi:NAD(P)-dependent dehydrogenase (short-subunit alcohol dehydrogenase family)
MELNEIDAIVTGGTSFGLGGATAEMLARRGAKVAIFDLNEEVVRMCAARPGHHHQFDAQRRNDPSRWRNPDGPAMSGVGAAPIAEPTA